jgi:hypothetical protein
VAKPPSPGASEFSPGVYLDAAREHIPVAVELYDAAHYVLSVYVAGLAVECMLRAYRMRQCAEFDARHDLLELYRISKFADVLPEKRIAEYTALLGNVAFAWSNAHRYRSEKSMRAVWKRMRLDRSVRRGDFVKELTRRAVHAAAELVTLGVQRWPT